MFHPVGLVSISLGSVVLDRPDRSGRYFAKDIAAGWAYLIGDVDGDSRYRGQGVCEGGLDATLRYAFLTAVSRVPESRQIKVLVETRQAHQMMVQLASKDPNVVGAIAGRLISVMTRPDARSIALVRTAAERTASAALRDREHAEWHQTDDADDSPAEGPAQPIVNDASTQTAGALRGWRTRLGTRTPERPADIRGDLPHPAAVPVPAISSVALRWLVRPVRNGLAAAGVLAPRDVPRTRAMTAWLQELDGHVATVRGDLQDVGA